MSSRYGGSSPVGRRIFGRGTWEQVSWVARALRRETTGGLLLLGAALVALVWANSPWRESYTALGEVVVGPAALHLDLTLATWAADGLLAIFFFVAGMELKHELVVGDLSSPAKAFLPVAAAVCGVVAPALLYVAVVSTWGDPDLLGGWAVPTATDIAFALAVLAVIGTHLPSALRAFLLTLAVVDDLIAITIIAVFYTDSLQLGLLGLAAVALGVFAVLVQRGIGAWWLLIPVALVAWTLMHASGVHATVAGVVMGLSVPVARRPGQRDLAGYLERRVHPVSAGFAVPVFAFFAAGVTVVGGGGAAAVKEAAAWAVVVGLVVGKLVGVFGGTWLLARFTRAELDDDLAWADVAGLSLLAGIGFTVALLVNELAFEGQPVEEHVKLAVLAASLLAALLAAAVLRRRNRVYRGIAEREARDDDGDGVPDRFQS